MGDDGTNGHTDPLLFVVLVLSCLPVTTRRPPLRVGFPEGLVCWVFFSFFFDDGRTRGWMGAARSLSACLPVRLRLMGGGGLDGDVFPACLLVPKQAVDAQMKPNIFTMIVSNMTVRLQLPVSGLRTSSSPLHE